ncbi:hypothetical protein QTH97_31785 [Variovorax sp. J22R24]|uniref:hypothetical protein n=1 Tax=Variovorax gracilis TaxID=3053502 RepID=UPI0025751FB6|nr:hypothetical protein [Variovorax sp. J22R24]MDM0109544.1 hypothetical protein [Variovorax sp. J22R24]
MLRPCLAARLDREAMEREEALRDSSSEATGLRRLHECSTRRLTIRGLQPLLAEVIDAMIGLHGGGVSLVHLVERGRSDPVAVAQRGISESCSAMSPGPRTTAWPAAGPLHSGARSIVEDVDRSGLRVAPRSLFDLYGLLREVAGMVK